MLFILHGEHLKKKSSKVVCTHSGTDEDYKTSSKTEAPFHRWKTKNLQILECSDVKNYLRKSVFIVQKCKNDSTE